MTGRNLDRIRELLGSLAAARPRRTPLLFSFELRHMFWAMYVLAIILGVLQAFRLARH
jgi:hypothetical protein